MRNAEPVPEPSEALNEVARLPDLHRVGTFRFWFSDGQWVWSAGVAQMHGYPAVSMTPTTEVLLAHKHPADREAVEATLAESVEKAAPFCSSHRIIDIRGRTHNVLVVADTIADERDQVIGTAGYYIDMTGALHEQRQETLDDALPELFAARSSIEQVKGALMLVYHVDAEQAFRLLAWRSQETNTKLRALAEQMVYEFPTLHSGGRPLRAAFDHLFLTAHERTRAP